jgi:hypothetical protein
LKLAQLQHQQQQNANPQQQQLQQQHSLSNQQSQSANHNMHQQDNKVGGGGGSVTGDGSMSNSFRGNDQVSPFIVTSIPCVQLSHDFSVSFILRNHWAVCSIKYFMTCKIM